MRLWVPELAVLVADPAAAAPSRAYRGSNAEKIARTKGRKLIKEIALDLDGDRVEEAGIVEQLAAGKMRVAVLKPTAAPDDESGGFKVLFEGAAR